ncbi:NADPH-dependent FMN reductase [Stackebrandtia soli]|uniref:NADPH-dependent FMN reductase n=1 Tax=Stackebrandtia soli TaxID=1892856 RepID=UPI0039EA64D5
MTSPLELRFLVLSASTRSGSLNTRLAQVVADRLAGHNVGTVTANLRDFPLPLYEVDVQEREGIPEAAHRLGDLLRETDGFVIASPEYNFSMPAILKNAIDWVSRIKPWPFTGRNGLLVSASPGALGGYRCLAALRTPLEGLGARLSSGMYTLPKADSAFAPDGSLADESNRDRLAALVSTFVQETEANAHYHKLRQKVTT